MISVGIDVSKDKSMVCALRPYGEIVIPPYEMEHTEESIQRLAKQLVGYDEEVKVIMESTGAYHLPVLLVLQEAGIFVCAENPFITKKYATSVLRKAKTDRIDSIRLANYGIDNWYRVKEYTAAGHIYEELKFLSRQYHYYTKLRVMGKIALTTLLDRVMPGIKKLINSNVSGHPSKYKAADFAEEYWHYDNILTMTKPEFIADYKRWVRNAGYYNSSAKAEAIYDLASVSVTSLPSTSRITKIMVQEAVRVLRSINQSIEMIQGEMQELAKELPEYETVRAMSGVGDVLGPRLIGEIGDVRRFYSGKALVAFAGIDSPPYQSGSFTGTHRRISKRGSAVLRKTGYEIVKTLKTNKPTKDTAVYDFVMKKQAEGKPKKVATIAGLNKFLRIYYARVTEVHNNRLENTPVSSAKRPPDPDS